MERKDLKLALLLPLQKVLPQLKARKNNLVIS
jgi:hypothetical protein